MLHPRKKDIKKKDYELSLLALFHFLAFSCRTHCTNWPKNNVITILTYKEKRQNFVMKKEAKKYSLLHLNDTPQTLNLITHVMLSYFLHIVITPI